MAFLAALFDAYTGKIPNLLTLFAIGLGIVLSPLRAIDGMVWCFAMAFLQRRWRLGGGDWKLLLALGALRGGAIGIAIECFAASFLISQSRIEMRAGPAILFGTVAATITWRILTC